MPAKGGFIAFDAAVQGRAALLKHSHALAHQQEKPLGGFQRSRRAKPQAIRRNPKNKTFQQLTLARLTQARTVPHTAEALAQTTATALAATIAQMPKPMMTTAFATLSYDPNLPEFSPV